MKIKLSLYRITAFTATSLVCAFVSWSAPIAAQEAEVEETPIEATIAGEAIPEQAKTIEDPTIAIEDLELLVKPLTLEELQHEAAAWLFLLKDKVQQISETEIAIKRENRKIEAEQKSIQLLEDAQAQLLAAKKAQAEAKPNTPEYEEAVKQLEKAKEALKEAEASIQKVTEAEAEIEEDKALQESVEEAKQERVITEARAILEKAQKLRKDMAADSPQYKEVTGKIDILEESINALEKVEEDLEGTVPDSPEYKEVSGKVTQARQAVKNATLELTKIMPGLVEDTSALTGAAIAGNNSETENLAQKAEKIEELFSQVPSNLENTEEQIDVENLDQSQVQEAEQQLEKVTEELEKKAQEEAEIKNQLVVNVTNLQSEQTGIIDRFNVVLDELDSKGGESVGYRKYIDAISGVEIDVTDTEGLGVRLIGWLKSDEGGVRWGINLAKFLGILLSSVIVARIMASFTNRVLMRVGGVSSLFREFIVMLVNRGVLVIGALVALTSLGISLGPLLAVLGGASFVLAFALQNNLGNFASGLMLLINKPFDVGDEVKIAGYWSYVESISIASTKLKDFYGNIVTLPNNTVWGGDIINYTHANIRKLYIPIHVKFTQDLDRVYEMWMNIAAAHPKVLDDPAPSWFPWNSHYDYYIYVGLSAWSKTDDYWEIYIDLLKELQKQIEELNIELTAPQQQIKLDRLLPETVADQIQPDNQLIAKETITN